MRPRSTIWLTQATRFADLARSRARVAALILALLLAASLTAIWAPGPPPVSSTVENRADDQADIMLYEAIVDGVRHGGDYYLVTSAALRAGDYPLKPFVTFRLPTLAAAQALLPPVTTLLLLYALAFGTAFAWFLRLRPAFKRPPPLIVALVLLAGGMGAFVQSELVAFHEVWAGLLVALSLAVRRDDRFVEAVAIGTMAMLIRETAALYAIVMAVIALLEGRRREVLCWGLGLTLLGTAVVAHAYAVAQVVRASDVVSPGWSGMLGFGFFVEAMTLSTALRLAPQWLASLLFALSMLGWAGWRDTAALRVIATFAAYALLIALFGRVDTFYWSLMVAPTLLVGLAFAPDALRDLYVAARGRSRVTVTRVSS